ncbi:MAG: lysine 5,6-aminomutase subunit alpha [Anaerolineaceae bacterium]|nr:lysine 5,6-aminomutase subunit alpha [Anaerolineaceae bacterium]
MAKLKIDWEKVRQAREAARQVVDDVHSYTQQFTTTTIERSICRLFGIDGVDPIGVPLPNVVVEHLASRQMLGLGVAYWLGQAAISLRKTPQEIAEAVAHGEMDLTQTDPVDLFEIQLWAEKRAEEAIAKIHHNRIIREDKLREYGDHTGPLIYVIVATGNIYEDIVQAVAAAKQGADVIAVIRTTGQSLLDYVPYGATTEGFGGTMATQENFRLMREALDEVGAELKRYIRLCNYCSGLCMPEIAVMGAYERLDVMLNDALYGILFRDINMQRTLIDQEFSRMINAAAGVIINTGEDNYLTTSDAYEEAHTVLASQLINEQFALKAGLPEEQMGLGHAFEMNPELKNAFLYEFAQAQLARQIFPNAPLKYLPPTKFKTGNIFKSHVQDALFNIVTVISNQRIHLLGMLTEAIHTPFLADRALGIENARYIANSFADFGEDIEFREGGIMEQRAADVLDLALDLLQTIRRDGLFRTIEEGKLAGIKRPFDGGKGLAGVVLKEEHYMNPFISLLLEESRQGSERYHRALASSTEENHE